MSGPADKVNRRVSFVDAAVSFNEDGELDYKPGWVDANGALCIPEYYNEEDPDSSLCQGSGVAKACFGMWSKGVSQTFTMQFKKIVK